MWSCLLSPSFSSFFREGRGSVEEKGIEDNYLFGPNLIRQVVAVPQTPERKVSCVQSPSVLTALTCPQDPKQ